MFDYFYFTFHVIICTLVFVHSKVIYNIVAPGVIRPYFKYNVAVSVHNTDVPCEMQVGLYASTYNVSKVISVLPESTEIIEFEIPKVESGEFQLKVKGITYTTIDNSTNLIYYANKPIILIQTNKKVYKPGDTVHFRVLFLNEKTQPAMLNNSLKVFILDKAPNLIRIWKDVHRQHGVFTDSFQLSEQAVLGYWAIQVYADEEFLEMKSFEVAKYELSSFEVFIESPDNVALTDEVIGVTTWARYSFGKPVKGKATVSVADYQSAIEKTIPISAKGYIEFDIRKELAISGFLMSNSPTKSFQIHVTFEEEATGDRQNSTSSITLHKNIIIEPARSFFQPGQLFTSNITVRKLDGSPVQDDKNYVELHLDDFVYYSLLNDKGVAAFAFVFPNSTEFVNIFCKYLNVRKDLYQFYVRKYTDNDGVELTLRTENPKLGNYVSIEVKWKEPIKNFIYIVTARGNIVKAEHIEVPSDSNLYELKINTTFDMIPKATILVQYIFDNSLQFKELNVDFVEKFRNTLQITTINQTSPGDEVEFQISTNPNSFVGISAVDQRVFGEDNDLSKKDVFKQLNKCEPSTSPLRGKGHYQGKVSGLVTLTNANYPFKYTLHTCALDDGFSYGEDWSGFIPTRTNFPGTWIFENFITPNNSKSYFTKKIPDTLTSWVITGFSINNETGIALTEDPTTIQVFKPFFISVNLPYSVKQGEVISIPVLIFNYMNSTIDTEVTMDNSDKEYEFIDAANDVDDRPVHETKRFKRIAVSSDDIGSVSFMIRPKIIGMTTIKVRAVTSRAGDSVHRRLKVEPEGITKYQNRAFFIHLNGAQEQEGIITLDVPTNAVPQSEHIELSAIGDLIGLSIANIDNLVRVPFGYGEQNMINFIPSILALEYLQTINRNLPNVTKNALNVLKIGYQRELSFKCWDGSFSVYGESDGSGSTWLTAYVIRYFQQASKFIDIDEDVVRKAFDFLISKQTTNGNFAEFGNLFEFPHLNDVALSAFVLLAFLEKVENSIQYNANIQKGLRYLVRSVEDTEDMHTLSIVALVLQKAIHPLGNEVLNRLKAHAKNENGLTWWTSNTKRHKRKYSTVSSNSDIEITSYIALAMLEKESAEEVLPIIKWLTMQRNSNGGFISTQDTVVGLQALIKFAEKTEFTHSGAMDIDYVCVGPEIEDRGTIKIDAENSMVLMKHELPKGIRQVKFKANGNGSSLIQLSYNYNTVDKEPDSSFTLNISVRKDTPPKQLIIDVCGEFIPSALDSEDNKTNMVVMEVTLPSGFAISKEELDKIRDFESILFTETKKSDSVAVIYLRGLEAGREKCLTIKTVRRHDVAKQKPTPVVIYDYYDRDRRATEFYEVSTSLCDICEAEECVADCKRI